MSSVAYQECQKKISFFQEIAREDARIVASIGVLRRCGYDERANVNEHEEQGAKPGEVENRKCFG